MPTLGVVFPGQGSQAASMGVDVAANFPAARECYDRASRVLGYNLLELCANGSEEALRETRVSQPAIFTTNVAIYRAVESLGLAPVVSAGHSFGEYCSLTIAGSIAFDDAIGLVNERGLAMGAAADLSPGAMAAIIGFESDKVEELCARARAATGGRVGLANLNAPIQIVVSGDATAVNAAGEMAKAAGAKRVVMLNVSGAWHSELMGPAVTRFEKAIARAQIRMPLFAVVSNVEVVEYSSTDQIRRCLVASLMSRVRWHETAELVARRRPDFIVECGASSVLAPMMRRLPGVAADRCVSVSDAASIAKLEKLATAAETSA